MMFKPFGVYWYVLVFFGVGSCFAANGDEAAMEDLLAVLEQTTEIATKTNMNSDFVPGFVTVITGRELRSRGARTLGEGLPLVSGIQVAKSGGNSYEFVARALGKGFVSGKYRMMVNGRAFNSGNLDSAPEVLSMPVALIDRVEVIRGPGSALYGEFALVAVINVITIKEKQFFEVRYDAELKAPTATAATRFEKDHVNLDISVFWQRGHGPELESGEDAFHFFGAPELSLSPGKVNSDLHNREVIARLTRKQTKVDFVYLEEGRGSNFGLVDRLTFHTDGINLIRQNVMLGLTQDFELAESLNAKLSVSGRYRHFEARDILDESPLLPSSAAFPRGKRRTTNANELESRATFEITTKQGRHRLLFGAYAGHTKIIKSNSGVNYIGDRPVGQLIYSTRALEGASRELFSFYGHDDIEFNESFTLSLGGRFDSYDDISDQFTPRIAAVYRGDNGNIFKFQYAEAFRPPTLGNLSEDPTLVPEDNQNFELGFIRHVGELVFRSHVFYSLYDKQFRRFQPQGRDLQSLGIELELESRIGDNCKVSANVSFVDAEDRDTEAPVEDVASETGNFAFTWQPTARYSLVNQLRFLGDRDRVAGDTRPSLDGWTVFDLIANMNDVLVPGFEVQVGARNLFDEDISDPSVRYRNDYPQVGRDWWLSGRYSW